MPVTVELTYDMSKLYGEQRFEVVASTVAEAVAAARKRVTTAEGDFDLLCARTAVAVNGVLVRHRKRAATRLSDGDTVSFVKAAAGG